MNPLEPSLNSHIEEARKSIIDEGGISTIIFCGKLRSEGDISTVLQAHRKIVEDEVDSEHVNVTGILMAQGNSILHLLEGPSYSILRLLCKLAEHETYIDSIIQNGRIVYNVEDRPQRYFPEWYSCTIPERRSQGGDDLTAEGCNEVVHEMATNLLEVGKGLSQRAETQQHEEISFGSYADKLPGKNLILTLAASTFFFTLEEFATLFCDPFHVELETEQAWPVDRVIV